MKIRRSLDDIEEPTAEELAEIEEMANAGEIPDASQMSDEEKAQMRDVIANGNIVIPDNVRKQMADIGITEDEIVSMLLGSVGGKN